jgi:PAS domain S-box-containing protein
VCIPHASAIDLSTEEREFLRAKDTIVFVSQTRYPPFEFMDPNGQHEGMMLDVVRWIGVEAGFKPVFVDMPFLQAQQAVLSGKADILTSLFHSDKREEKFEFTEILFNVPASIFVKAERTDIKDLHDLNGKTIAIQKGDYAKEFLEYRNVGFTSLDTVDFAQATDMVVAGKADAVIGDEQIVIYHIFSNRLSEFVKKMGEPLYIGKTCMASSKTNTLLIGVLNKGINEARRSGVLDKISTKWLGAQYGLRKSFLERYLWPLSAAGGALLFLSLWVWGWNVRLRTLVRNKTELIVRREEALRESQIELSQSHQELEEIVLRLAESKNMLQLIIESIPVRVFWKDANSRYLGCNTLFARDAGFSYPEQLLGLDDFAMGWREQAELYRTDDSHVMRSGIPKMNILEPQTTPAGSKIWLDTSKVPLRLTNGEVFGVLGVYADITERKVTGEALSLRDSYLTAIIENQPGLLWLKDVEGRFLAVNHAFARSCGGQTPDGVAGKTDLDVWPRDLAEKYRADDLDVMSTRKPLVVEERIFDQGEEKWFQTFKTPVLSTDGQVLGTCGFALDITKRKQSEESLRESEARFRQLAENINQVFWIADRDMTGTLYVSPAYEKIWGRTCASLYATPRSWLDSVHPEDLEWVTHSLAKRGSEAHRLEYRIVRPDGAIRWVVDRGFPVRNDAGEIYRFAGIAEDITDRRLAEQVIQKSERKYRELVENANSIILRSNSRAEITFLNEYGQKFFGYEEEEILGRNVVGTIAPETESTGRDLGALIRNIRQEPTAFEQNVNENILRDGRRVWIAWTNKGVFDADGNLEEVLSIGTDITERKRAEQEREKLQAQLLQAQKLESVGRLAGGVAHDFNNMLGVIIGHTELALAQVDAAQPLFADLREIRKAAERSANLIRQLLAFARKQTVTPKVLDMNETVGGMLKMLRRLIGEDIQLTWLPGSGVWPVKIDPSQIDQILANLCVNARDAIDGVGHLVIKTENVSLDETYCREHSWAVSGEYVLLTVSDDGRGMDKETLVRLFEPFFTTKEVGKGTGLGLSTVYGIVKQNNGFIDVHSEPNQGATFEIYLPRSQGEAEETRRDGVALRASGQETILVVEDEPPILKLTARILEQEGYTVLAASTPGEAIRVAEEHVDEVHLLITDVIMPEMNGRDLAKRLLSLYPRIKLLYMSGYTADIIAHHGVLDDDVHFIQKPFTKQGLVVKLREALKE